MPPIIGGRRVWDREMAAELAKRWNEGQPRERIAAYYGMTLSSISSLVAVLRKKYPDLDLARRQKGDD